MTDYKSLDELMAGKAPGSVVVEASCDSLIFTPYFRAEGHWWGPSLDKNLGFTRKADEPIWKPHVPAPPKVKRWRWLVVPPKIAETVPYRDSRYYKDEQEARRLTGLNDPATTFHRIDETEKEFEW